MSNSFSAVGRLGRDAEMRQAGQTPVCSFSIAVEKGKKDDQGKQMIDWYSVDFFGSRGQAVCQYLTKGTQVFVTGQLAMDSFAGQNGPVTKPTINAANIKLLGSPQAQQQAAPPKQASPPKPVAAQADLADIFGDNEIPF